MALVIFDYDGVLADTLADLLQFGQAACDQLGVPHTVTQQDLNTLEVMSFSSYGRACTVPEQQVAEFVSICLNLFAAKTNPPAIFAGLGAVVRQLASQHTLAVVTTNSSHNVKAFLNSHDLAACVQGIYGVDSPGSKAQKIAAAQTQLLAKGQQASVFMIGDSLSDMRAAEEAGVTSIAVTWGHQGLEQLLRGRPAHVVHAPYELLAVIDS